MSTFITYNDVKVVGVTFDNNDGTSRQKILAKTKCDDALFIDFFAYEGEPAYAVRNVKGQTLGNLPKELSAEIFEKYPNNPIHAYVEKIVGGYEGLSYGCRITVAIKINDETTPENIVDGTPKEPVKKSFEFKFKIVELKNDILTVFTDSGEKLCSDTIQNYTLRFYNIATPIIGKNYLEVIFMHPATNRLITLKAKDNAPSFKELKTFCKYMKKHAKVELVKKRNQIIKTKSKKPFFVAMAVFILVFILLSKISDDSIKSGDYTIDGISFTFYDSVINDVTGKWRKSLVATSQDVMQYAIDYYNTLFESDDEVHAIVNFTLNTTTSISVLVHGTLHVMVFEYVDGEEHDAKTLCSGMLLGEYFIDIETGEINQIQ